jgi:hypothetical protein
LMKVDVYWHSISGLASVGESARLRDLDYDHVTLRCNNSAKFNPVGRDSVTCMVKLQHA